jgi:heterodisulfide reductase subunit A2
MPAFNTIMGRSEPAAAMVIGGGIGGMRAALDLADAGLKVFLIEQSPCLGGRVAQLGFMFPQHDCVLCRGTSDHGYGCTRPSISPSYITHNQHPNIEILTHTQVIEVGGQAGDFTVALRQLPRIVDARLCINCGECARVCPVELPDPYQNGLTMHKAAYKVAARANPDAYVIDRGPYCDDCRRCEQVCPSRAIHLDEQPRLLTLEVGAIILALGFQVYDPTEMQELGYRRYPNVVQAMEYERLASRSGPTEGLIVRPPTSRPSPSPGCSASARATSRTPTAPRSAACMPPKKPSWQSSAWVKGLSCDVFIMDERAFNKEYSTYFERARQSTASNTTAAGSRLCRKTRSPTISSCSMPIPAASWIRKRFEMVVLATGMEPPTLRPNSPACSTWN